MPEPWQAWEKSGRMGKTNRRKLRSNLTSGDFPVCLVIYYYSFLLCFHSLLLFLAIDTLARVAYPDWLDPIFFLLFSAPVLRNSVVDESLIIDY